MYRPLTNLDTDIIMNYIYMQVLQGSCVGNKQFWKLFKKINCITPKRVEFLDFCRSVGETNIS